MSLADVSIVSTSKSIRKESAFLEYGFRTEDASIVEEAEKQAFLFLIIEEDKFMHTAVH